MIERELLSGLFVVERGRQPVDWRYIGSTTGPTTPSLDAAISDDVWSAYERSFEAARHMGLMLASLVPLGSSCVEGLQNRERAFQNRAKKRKRRRCLAKAQRKHLVALKGKKAVGKMLAYNRRPREPRS